MENKLPQAISSTGVSMGAAAVSYTTSAADAAQVQLAQQPGLVEIGIRWVESHASFIATVVAVTSGVYAIRASMATMRYRRAQEKLLQQQLIGKVES